MTCSPTGRLIFEESYGLYSPPAGFTFGIHCRETQEENNE